MTIGWTLAIAAAALAWPWRRDGPGPFGAIAAATLLLLAVDVMAGSRLQLDAPFGLSLLLSGRFLRHRQRRTRCVLRQHSRRRRVARLCRD